MAQSDIQLGQHGDLNQIFWALVLKGSWPEGRSHSHMHLLELFRAQHRTLQIYVPP